MAKAVVGSKKPSVRRTWSKDDLRVLKSMARKEPLARIAKALKRTEAATRHKATITGVSLALPSRKKASPKKR